MSNRPPWMEDEEFTSTTEDASDSAADLPQKKTQRGKGLPSLKDLGKSVGGGFLGSVEAGLEGVDWLGDKLGVEGTASEDAAASLRQFREENLTPEVSNILTDIASGVGSLGAFLVPGGLAARMPILLARGAQVSAAAMKWAEAAGIASSSALEALAEAGSVYRENLDAGKDEEEAQDASTKVFFKNMALLGVTNKLSGFFEVGGKSLKKAIGRGFVFEGTQEAGQSVISQQATGDGSVDLKEAAYEGLIGGIVGGGAGGVISFVDKKVLKTDDNKPGSVTVDSDGLNSGMTQEQLEDQLNQKDRVDRISQYSQWAQGEIERETLAEQDAAEQAYRQKMAEQAEKAALYKAENEMLQNKQFVDSISTRDGLLDVTASAIPELMEEKDSKIKRIANELKNAHRALWMGDNSTTAIKERLYEIEQIEQSIDNQHISMIASRLKDELTTEYTWAEQREQEQEEAKQEKAEGGISRAKQYDRNRAVVDDATALENQQGEAAFDERAKATRQRLQKFETPKSGTVAIPKQDGTATSEKIRLRQEGQAKTSEVVKRVDSRESEVAKQRQEKDRADIRAKLRSKYGPTPGVNTPKLSVVPKAEKLGAITVGAVLPTAGTLEERAAKYGPLFEEWKQRTSELKERMKLRKKNKALMAGTIKPVYDEIVKKEGVSNIPIADLRDSLGVSQDEMAEVLTRASRDGSAVLTDTGYTSGEAAVTDRDAGAAVDIGGKKMTHVRIDSEPKVSEAKPSKAGTNLPGVATRERLKLYGNKESAKRAIRKSEGMAAETHRPEKTPEGWRVVEKPDEEKGKSKYSRVSFTNPRQYARDKESVDYGKSRLKSKSKPGARRLEEMDSRSLEADIRDGLRNPDGTIIPKDKSRPKYSRKATGERVQAAAIRTPDGRVVSGVSHGFVMLDNPWLDGFKTLEDGFVTTTGRFVDRKEAARIHDDIGRDVAISEDFEHLDSQRMAREDEMNRRGPFAYSKYLKLKDRFSKTTVVDANEVKHQMVSSAIEGLNRIAKRSINTKVVRSQDQLPKHLRPSKRKDRIAAVIDRAAKTPVVYIVSENVAGVNDAVSQWMHEQVGHYGVFQFLKRNGVDTSQFMGEVYKMIQNDKQFRQVYNEVARDYAEDVEHLDDAGKQAYFVEEFLGRYSEKLNPTKRQLLWEKIRNFINKWLKSTFRGFDVGLSKSEFNSVMEASKNWVLHGEERKWDEFVETDETYKRWAKEVLEKNPEIVTWYDNHTPMVKEVIGDDANLFNVLLAWTSPQATPTVNAQWAVESYLYLRGLRGSPGGKYPNSLKTRIDKWKQGKFQESLVSDAFKVNEFLRGLLGDKNATVNDRWMYRVFFGPSKLTPAFAKEGANESDADSKWLIDENTAARNKLMQLAKELTEETGHKWSPRDFQAALWVHKKSADTKTPLEKAYDYREGLNTPTDKFGGLSPIQHLKKQLANAKTPSLSEELGIDKIDMSPVSSLEKARLEKLAELNPAEDISDNPKKLKAYIEEMHRNKERHVLTIPTLKELQDLISTGARVYTFANGKAGYTLTPEKDMQKGFNNSDTPGLGTMMLCDGIARGGLTNDCFDGFLPKFYSSVFGWVETGREPFNEKYMSQYWDLQKHGRPDVVYMKLSEEALRRYKDGKTGKISGKQVRGALGGYRTDWTRFDNRDIEALSDTNDSSDNANLEGVQQEAGTGLDQGERRADQERPEGPGNDVKFSKVTPKQQQILDHIGMGKVDTSAQAGPSLEMGFWDRTLTNWVDSLHPLKVLEKKVRGKELNVDESGYKSFNLWSNFNNMLRSILYDGTPKFENGWLVVNQEKEGGLFTVVKDLGEDADSFFQWMTAKSAEEMMTKGLRKNLFGKNQKTGEMLNDSEVIQTLYDVTKEKYTANKDKWDKARGRLQQINKSVLDFAEKSGLISKEDRASWERDDYIPFYRVLQDNWTSGDSENNLKTMFPKSGAPHIGKIHRLEGSAMNMGDPMMNLVNSYSFIMNESLKNLARAKTLKVAGEAGMLMRTFPREGKNIIAVRDNGKATYYKVSDPMLYDAMVEMEGMSNGKMSEAMKILSMPKRLLTAGVTLAPAFRIANFVRDTLQTTAMQRSFVPVLDSMRGLVHSWRRSDQFKEFMSTGGGFGGSYHSRDVIARDQKSLDNLKKELAGKPGGFYGSIRRSLDFWDRVGDASENAARMGAYLRGVENGMNKADAAYFAKDLLDFHRHGKGGTAMFLIRTIPFLNARIQGFYRLGRAATDPANRMKLLITGMLVATASAMLHAYNDGEDWYDELPKNEHMAYWHIPIPGGRLRVPKPFEFGIVAGAMPEALMSRASGKWDDEELGDFFKTITKEVLRVDWPQFVKPMVTQYANKDPFTGAPIVPRGEENLEGPLQFGPRTSRVARAIAEVMPEGFDSPRRIDKFADDVFGSMAFIVREAIDNLILPHFGEYPEDPADRVSDHWLFGRFVREDGSPMGFTRQQDVFYRMLQEGDQALATLREYKKLGNADDYRAFVAENTSKIRQAKVLTKVQKQVSLINQKIKLIHRSASMDAEEKRDRIDELLDKRNSIFSMVVDRLRG